MVARGTWSNLGPPRQADRRAGIGRAIDPILDVGLPSPHKIEARLDFHRVLKLVGDFVHGKPYARGVNGKRSS